jgi:hypothetical protein
MASRKSNTMAVVSIYAAIYLALQPSVANGGSPMQHDIDGLPPYTPDKEQPADEPAFSAECLAEAKIIAEKNGWKLHDPLLTYNPAFGLVWRVDFIVPDGGDEYADRIMFWKLADGTLAKFIGANLGVPPLHEAGK